MLENFFKSIIIVFICLFAYRLWGDIIHPAYRQIISIIIGPTGAGKTSLAVAKKIRYYNKFDDRIHNELNENIIPKLQQNGYSNLELPDILATSDIDIRLNKNGLKTNYFSYDDLCLLLDHEMQSNLNFKNFLPLGSYCTFDEIANKADCRESMTFSNGMSALLNLHRKGYYSFTFIYPHFDDVDKRIRKSCHEINYVKKQIHIRNIFKKGMPIIATVWDYVTYTGPKKIKSVENGEIPGIFTSFICWLLGIERTARRRFFVYFGNIFEQYESRAEIAYFLKNVYTYKTTKKIDFEYSRTFVNQYCKNNPVFLNRERTKSGRRKFLENVEKQNRKLKKMQEKTIIENINQNQQKTAKNRPKKE